MEKLTKSIIGIPEEKKNKEWVNEAEEIFETIIIWEHYKNKWQTPNCRSIKFRKF